MNAFPYTNPYTQQHHERRPPSPRNNNNNNNSSTAGASTSTRPFPLELGLGTGADNSNSNNNNDSTDTSFTSNASTNFSLSPPRGVGVGGVGGVRGDGGFGGGGATVHNRYTTTTATTTNHQQQHQNQREQRSTDSNYQQRHENSNNQQQQSSRELEDLLRQLVVSATTSLSTTSPQPTKEWIQKLKQYINQQQSQQRVWSWMAITQFVEWTLYASKSVVNSNNSRKDKKLSSSSTTTTANDNSSDSAAASAVAVACEAMMCISRTAENCWSDSQVYAAAIYVPDDDEHNYGNNGNGNNTSMMNLLQVAHNLATVVTTASTDNNISKSRRTVQSCALVLLTTLWRALERLERWTCPPTTCTGGSLQSCWSRDAVWWMDLQQQEGEEEDTGNYDDDDDDGNGEDGFTGGNQRASVADVALQLLLYQPYDGSSSSRHLSPYAEIYDTAIVRPEEVQIACVSLLTKLLQHDQPLLLSSSSSSSSSNWLLTAPTDLVRKLVGRLQVQVDRLKDPNMPLSSYTNLSLASLHLLLLTHSYSSTGTSSGSDSRGSSPNDRLLPALQHVVRAVCQSPTSPSGPRWTQSSAGINSTLNKWTLPILYTWLDTDAQEARKALGTKGGFTEQTWSRLFDMDPNTNNISAHDRNRNRTPMVLSSQAWQSLVFMFWHCRAQSKESLNTALSVQRNNSNGGANQLFCVLLDCIRRQESLEAAVILRSILEDRRSSVTHDELSRKMWKCAADSRLVLDCLELVSSLKSSQSPTSHPRLLCLLDILHLLLSMEPSLCQSALSALSAQSIESIVNIMAPKEVRLDQGQGTSMDTTIMSEDGSTPPANNLSHDKTTMFSFCEMEEIKPKGMEPTVRIAAATVLAVLGEFRGAYTSDDTGRVTLLQSRMMDAVHSFVGDLQLSFTCQSADSFRSHDMTRRRLRLLSYLAAPENEDYLATMLHSADLSQRRRMYTLKSDVLRYKQSIQDYRKRQKQLLAEKEKCLEKCEAQSVVFQRQKSEFQRSTAQNAKSLVQVHQAERAKAELRAQELSNRTRDTEKRLAEAARAAEMSRRAELESRSALEDVKAKLNELATSEQEAVRRDQESTRKLGQATEELRSTNKRLEQIKRNEEKLLAQINSQKEALANMNDSQFAMQDSLESLFGDMVSLAQMYERKEREEKSSRESGEVGMQKLKKKLDAERARYGELEEKYRQAECENDMLSRKYARTREKLEKEREDRQKEAVDRRKRAGPVSYINQLHQSSSSGGKENNESQLSTSTSYRPSRKKHNRDR